MGHQLEILCTVEALEHFHGLLCSTAEVQLLSKFWYAASETMDTLTGCCPNVLGTSYSWWFVKLSPSDLGGVLGVFL